MLLWNLPLAIVFFTIVVVVLVTVGKGGHSLGRRDDGVCPQFLVALDDMAGMGRVWDDGCGLQCMMRGACRHDAQQPAIKLV